MCLNPDSLRAYRLSRERKRLREEEVPVSSSIA